MTISDSTRARFWSKVVHNMLVSLLMIGVVCLVSLAAVEGWCKVRDRLRSDMHKDDWRGENSQR